MSSEPARRLFFALWPDDLERGALAHAVRKAVRASGGRPVPEANLHLTLTFLGAVPEARVPGLSAIGRRVAAAFPDVAIPLALTLQGFAHWGQSQVLTVLVREEPGAPPPGNVLLLARTLAHEAAQAGFNPDLKPFRVHVTVARKVARAPRSSEMRKVQWSFDAFALIESR
ncbi:MAG TPA: RNA 2',3'-cyclic phosphodiesterase, partial [Steroidobacteraceae bacterium]|nr:RNA 2',3'-cyclic phosphodiesterase [Steroidobacteraceae bacterium]